MNYHSPVLYQGMPLQLAEKVTKVCATVEERPFRAA
jgi:hypothetical protein